MALRELVSEEKLNKILSNYCRVCYKELTDEEKQYDPKDMCVDCYWKEAKQSIKHCPVCGDSLHLMDGKWICHGCCSTYEKEAVV